MPCADCFSSPQSLYDIVFCVLLLNLTKLNDDDDLNLKGELQDVTLKESGWNGVCT